MRVGVGRLPFNQSISQLILRENSESYQSPKRVDIWSVDGNASLIHSLNQSLQDSLICHHLPL